MENEQDKLDDLDAEFPEEEDEEERERRIQQEYNPGLLKAAQKGDLDELRKMLEKGAQILTEDKKKWNALVWAACRGNVDVVRFLLSRGAGVSYKKGYYHAKGPNDSPLKDNTSVLMNKSAGFGLDDPSAQQKADKTNGPGVINDKARNTPLQWACFKGHPQVIALLLKDGQDLLECDSFGNNAIHQAVAGEHVQSFRLLLQWGIKLNYVNNRGHTVVELCTNPEIMKYIKKFKETEKALGIDPKEDRTVYLCSISDTFKPEKEVESFWLYENKDSTEKEKFETRSHEEHKKVLQHQDELMELIRSYDYGALTTKIRFIEDKDIHVETKLLDKAYIHQEKLRTQIEIMDFIHSVAEIDNYKTIKKSINILEEKVRDAVNRGVNLDQNIFDAVKVCTDRLVAERNLRFELDNLQINGVKHEEVKTLEEKKGEAKERSVAGKYLENAEELKTRMEKHLHAREILKNFLEYPPREQYPLFKYYFDLKTGKKMDRATKKPIDPAKLYHPKPKKKGKKAPKWVIPEWATETAQLKIGMQTLDSYITDKEDLELDDEFIKQCQAQIAIMKEEFELRVELDKEAKFEAEKKAKKKKT